MKQQRRLLLRLERDMSELQRIVTWLLVGMCLLLACGAFTSSYLYLHR